MTNQIDIPDTSRTDQGTAEIIENAIEAMRDSDACNVAKFLSAAGVSFSVTVRVVSEPTRRRRCQVALSQSSKS